MNESAGENPTAAARPKFLMCPPDHFGVDYVINPWMEGNLGRANRARAAEQWGALRDRLATIADVELMKPAEGLPDLVFTANAALVLGAKAVLSRFRHSERRDEEPLNREWFASRAYETIELPAGLSFEGAGDARFDAERDLLWLGYGFRTSLESAAPLAEALRVEVVPLRLVDDRFYHLDTCFAPLAGGRVVYYPPALDERALRTIEQRVTPEKRLAVAERDALDFACNCIDAGGTIVLNRASPALAQRLEAWGYEVIQTPLTEFMLAGGAARCLVLRLDETLPEGLGAVPEPIAQRVVALEGHLLDTGLLARVMDLVTEGGCDFETLDFRAGSRREDHSLIRLSLSAPSADLLESVVTELLDRGATIEAGEQAHAAVEKVEAEGVAPEDFYSTTIYPTDVRIDGRWIRAEDQRMDGVIVLEKTESEPRARVRLLRDLKSGDSVVVGVDGIRIQPQRPAHRGEQAFAFMSSEVSSERRVELAVDAVAWEMTQVRERGGKILVVAGPVVVHTGGIPYLCELVCRGYVQALLSGNALAVHDIESALFGTSLGVDLKRGAVVQGGHRNHLRAINAIRRCGSIAAAAQEGVLTSGLMFELTKKEIPYSLAGSIRDDGPLPETQMDLVEAQSDYSRLIAGADMILMLSTMLHSIGVGNMTPAGVSIVCVDINQAVATKLADRGSVESRAIVTDVGLFLNLLVRKIDELESAPAAR